MNANNGAAILKYLLSKRPDKAAVWTVPWWQSPVSSGVYPIGVTVDDHFLLQGTAFVISKLGTVATALHNINQAIALDRLGARRRHDQELPKEATLIDAGISLFHNAMVGDGRVTVSTWPLESIDGAPPTDLAFGSPTKQSKFKIFPLPLSFSVPRIGSKVYCVGYGDMRYPKEGIPLSDIRDGDPKWVKNSSLDLRVVEGRVSKILTKGIAKSYPTGPCVMIEGLVAHGQSGGPVFNEEGFVCGIVSSGGSMFMPDDSSIFALLFPALLHPIKIADQLGSVRITTRFTLMEQIARGYILSDGSEKSLPITEEEEGMAVGLAIHPDDAVHTHDDLKGMQENLRAERIDGPMYRVKLKSEDSAGD